MMNLDQIAARIANPATCQGSEIPALKELTEKYPYAQIFSILYLKALAGQNHISFDEALQEHAYRITDRMKLYDLIHEEKGEIHAAGTEQETTYASVMEEQETEVAEASPKEIIAEIAKEETTTDEADRVQQETAAVEVNAALFEQSSG